MARKPASTDFDIVVEGIGRFRFANRTMRDHLKIEAEYSRIIDGVEPTAFLKIIAEWISVLRVLTVDAPDGWNIDNMDPLDSVTYENLRKVHKALSDKEADFRGWANKAQPKSGEDKGEDAGVLVSPEIQPDP